MYGVGMEYRLGKEVNFLGLAYERTLAMEVEGRVDRYDLGQQEGNG